MTNNISSTCEVWVANHIPCGKTTVAGYPAMGGGYMALCDDHAPKHAAYTQPVEDIRAGIPHPWDHKRGVGR